MHASQRSRGVVMTEYALLAGALVVAVVPVLGMIYRLDSFVWRAGHHMQPEVTQSLGS